MTDPAETNPIDRALEIFRALVDEDPDASAALADARPEFLGVDGAATNGTAPSADPERERRLFEWFLFEHESERLGGLPARALLEDWVMAAEAEVVGLADKLLESRAGVYEVTGIEDGGVWLSDLAGSGEYPLAEPDAAGQLEPGDLVVGRLYPVGDGIFRASPSAVCLREPSLAEALRKDLTRVREGRRGAPRLSQALLEHTFFSRTAAAGAKEPPPEQIVAETRAWLLGRGLDEARAEAVLDVLRSEPIDPNRPTTGGDDALGRVLDVLAFETRLELDEARRRLASCWQALGRQALEAAREGSAPTVADDAFDDAVDESLGGGGAEPDDVAEALARFDANREAGGELDVLFDQLERDLGIDGEEDDGLAAAPDFPGVVGAMVEEFLWDDARQGGGAAEAARALREFGAYGSHIGVLEDLTQSDLVVFATCYLLERGGLVTADDARDAMRGLRSFCLWADENHDLSLWGAFESTHASLSESLPRLVVANRALPGGADTSDRRVVALEVTRTDGDVELRRGERTERVALAADVREHLRVGDVVRATTADEELRVLGCYPPEAAGVLGLASA